MNLRVKFERHNESAGKTNLDCVTLYFPVAGKVASDFFPVFCFDPAIPVLRLSSSIGNTRTIYESIVQFQGHYLAREIHTYRSGRPRSDLSLDLIERLKEPAESILILPSTALPVDLTNVSLKSDFPGKLKTMTADFSEEARIHGIQGTVAVQFTVGKDGHVTDAQAVSGPPVLQPAAVNAVRQWFYKPLLVMGQPIEFKTRVDMDFFHKN